MREVIAPALRPEALALLRKHQRAGDIVTATNEFVTRPIAQALGVGELLAMPLARDASGWYTGEIEGTPTMRAKARCGAWSNGWPSGGWPGAMWKAPSTATP